MKKIAAITITSFYLLLTTGMFVCLLHCTGAYLLKTEFLSSHDDHAGARMRDHKKTEGDCSGSKSCRCCNIHDNFVIKENLQVASDSQIPEFNVIDHPVTFFEFTEQEPVVNPLPWQRSHAPPAATGKQIIIRLRTLLI